MCFYKFHKVLQFSRNYMRPRWMFLRNSPKLIYAKKKNVVWFEEINVCGKNIFCNLLQLINIKMSQISKYLVQELLSEVVTQKCSVKKVFSEILQNSQENNYARDFLQLVFPNNAMVRHTHTHTHVRTHTQTQISICLSIYLYRFIYSILSIYILHVWNVLRVITNFSFKV